jgi:predicted transcriptional regulator
MRKIEVPKEEVRTRFNKAFEFLDRVIEEPDRYPDRLVVFFWSDEELSRLFTRKRLKLLKKVKEKTHRSITELAKELGRDISSVRKDLKLLEGYGLVKLERAGNEVRISSDKEGIYVPLVEPKPIAHFEGKR